MSNFKHLFSKDFIFLENDFPNKEELFVGINKVLLEKGRVKETFLNAIIERENDYPTGLPVLPYGVAIPHTQAHHVIDPCIVVIKPKNPVDFKEMGSGENDIACKFIFMLVVKNNGEQVELLQLLLSIFTNEELMNKLMVLETEEEILEFITELV